MRLCILVWDLAFIYNMQLANDHTDTGTPVLLPFRMSAYVFSNLVVTAGMLTPGLGVSISPHIFNPANPKYIPNK
jgi:hypothetical protein